MWLFFTFLKNMRKLRAVLLFVLEHKQAVSSHCLKNSQAKLFKWRWTLRDLFLHRCIIFGPPVNDRLCWFISNGSSPSLGGTTDTLRTALLCKNKCEHCENNSNSKHIFYKVIFNFFLLGLGLWWRWWRKWSFILYGDQKLLVGECCCRTGLCSILWHSWLIKKNKTLDSC